MRAVTITLPDDLPPACRDYAAAQVRGIARRLGQMAGEDLGGEIALEPWAGEPETYGDKPTPESPEASDDESATP